MGARGTVPKDSSERRRRNKPVQEIAKITTSNDVEIAAPDSRWHPLAIGLYDAIAQSGQNQFYEPSDWAMARVMCENLSRHLSPQPFQKTDADGLHSIVMMTVPMKGAELAAYLKFATALLLTAGDRRRQQIEIQHANDKAAATAQAANVANIAEARNARLMQ